jgi:cytochrome c553
MDLKSPVLTWTLRAGAVVALIGLVGLLVAASGVIPVKASSGHWAITEWLLRFAKRRSIDTQTLTQNAPRFEERWLVLKGAGHYEGGCRPCHGSPEREIPRIAAAMTPPPPPLAALVAQREPKELEYVVRHGIKFTGMPAWPAPERDDEVRAVVAFLLELPKLSPASYRALVHGDGSLETETPNTPRAVQSSCARCHGADGLGRGLGAFPKLAGQKRDYLVAALEAYALNRRHSGIMGPIAASLEPGTRRALAAYYAELPAGAPPGEADPSRVARGRTIALEGVPKRGIPSCIDCHGPGAERRNPLYPNLSGQYRDFLVLQLELFREGRRGGSPYAHIMRHFAGRLTPEQVRDVASYYASLPVEGAARER